jgi:hypothetical protein
MFDSIPDKGVKGYIAGYVGDIHTGQKGWTTITPIFDTIAFDDDGLPPVTVKIMVEGVTNLEEDDKFIAFGSFTTGNDGKGYTMFANAVISLTEKEPPIEDPSENEEMIDDGGEEDTGFDMNDTGNDI